MPKSYLQTISSFVRETVVTTVPTDNASIAPQIKDARVSRLIDTGTPPLSVEQSCTACNRITKHFHYRGLHELFVFTGMASYLTLTALNLISGFTKGSTVLYFMEYEIEAYDRVMSKFNELMAPHEYLTALALVVEVLAVAFCIASAATLRSSVKIHFASLVGTLAFAITDILLNITYFRLVEDASTNSEPCR